MKDMVISGGENVYSVEVERVLSLHRDVVAAAVIGVPDPKWGEAVKAVVVLSPGHEASDDLTRELQLLVREAKGPQQAPKSIDYREELPLTPVGKLDKKAIRAEYWRDSDRAVG